MVEGSTMRIALAQLNPTIAAVDSNTEAILQAARRAKAEGARLVIASELAVPGYPPRDLMEREAFVEKVEEANQRIARELPRGIALVFGTLVRAEKSAGRLYNVALVVERGEVLARVEKRRLVNRDAFDEARHFEPGASPARVVIDGHEIVITIGESDCQDMLTASLSSADLLVNLSALPFDASRLRAKSFAKIAASHRLPLAFVNQVGGQDELLFDGESALFGPDGELLARAKAFEDDLLVADLESGGSMAESFTSDEEAIYRALTMGLRDYVKKSGFSKVALGLSGGIDSALVATIAADALGPANVFGVFLPTRYSSESSRTDAEALAKNLGIEYREVSIEPIFESYLEYLGPIVDSLGKAPEGDVTMENVQARIRCDVLMAISNRSGAMVLATSNKSETAVGYTTLYGDMAGGLAVLSDVPKTLVYRLCDWLNRGGERIPRSTITKPPSAELREGQLDEDSLPPYDLLDHILALHVEEGLSREEIIRETKAPDTVNRVIRLVHTSEYKRRQAAPGLFLTKKPFGIGRRVPIAHGFRD